MYLREAAPKLFAGGGLPYARRVALGPLHRFVHRATTRAFRAFEVRHAQRLEWTTLQIHAARRP